MSSDMMGSPPFIANKITHFLYYYIFLLYYERTLHFISVSYVVMDQYFFILIFFSVTVFIYAAYRLFFMIKFQELSFNFKLHGSELFSKVYI